MIESLLTQLESVRDVSILWVFLFVGFVMAFGGLALWIFANHELSQTHGKHMCIIGFSVIIISMIVLMYSSIEPNELRKEIKIEHREMIKNMSCDEILNEIVSVIEREHEPRLQPYDYQRDNFAWEERYYNTKCELPLRDEVLKLQ
jgi:hypothetical protein